MKTYLYTLVDAACLCGALALLHWLNGKLLPSDYMLVITIYLLLSINSLKTKLDDMKPNGKIDITVTKIDKSKENNGTPS
jgi:hypothetical protein